MYSDKYFTKYCENAESVQHGSGLPYGVESQFSRKREKFLFSGLRAHCPVHRGSLEDSTDQRTDLTETELSLGYIIVLVFTVQ